MHRRWPVMIVLATGRTGSRQARALHQLPGLDPAGLLPAAVATTPAHLNGCYTDGSTADHRSLADYRWRSRPGGWHRSLHDHDPFDGYALTIAGGQLPANTNQFTQMEGNFSLFWGLSIHAWGRSWSRTTLRSTSSWKRTRSLRGPGRAGRAGAGAGYAHLWTERAPIATLLYAKSGTSSGTRRLWPSRRRPVRMASAARP